MSGRALTVLSRLPAHLDAPREGKQLYVVADSVATILDDLSASLASVRRAHRLGHADATSDVQRLGALHRIAGDEYAPVDARLARLRSAAAELQRALDAHDDAARDAAGEALCDLLGVLGAPPRLALFAPPPAEGGSPDLAAGAEALLAATLGLTDYQGGRECVRARVATLASIHARGNGTVRALLEAAASALDLQPAPDAAAALKEQWRPVVSLATTGTPGTSRYGYVVVARSQSKSVDRRSDPVSIGTGNAALSATDAVVLTWERTPDARDYLVFRVENGADPTNVGLLTSVALPPDTTTFTDTGPSRPGAPDVAVDDDLFHSGDRFWHAAFVRPRVPVLAGDATATDIIGMEENPVRREWSPDPASSGGATTLPRSHGECFHVFRRGFGPSLLQVHVIGTGDRTVGPMIVNRDEGAGIAYAGSVPDGALLVFDESGHVTLDATDVTADAWAWQGACFAGDDDDPLAPHDALFDGPDVPEERRGRFAVATPLDAFEGSFTFPHAGDPLPVPGIGVGRTRFAFFVQEAHFSDLDDTVDPPVPVPLSPRYRAGFVEGSVMAPPPDADQTPAAQVSLSWLEHEAYAVRLLLPRRASLFDVDGQPPMTELVARALERHRPAGVELRVEYVEDRWILGASDVTGADAADPILSLRGGSVLWTPPAS
jgi:hypothetical protein